MRIGVDLDGVLGECGPVLKARIKQQFKIDVDGLDKIGFTQFFEENDLDSKWLVKQWNDEWLWSKATPYEDNIAAVKLWIEQGHEVHIITAREKQTTALVTRAWLKKHGLPIENLAFHPVMHKVDYLKARDIPVMFEDLFFEANKIASFGIPCFLVRRKWNAEYADRITNPLVRYIDSLSDANDFIIERV